MNLSNNTILITGGSSGIGLAMAKKFAELNNTVIITGRDAARLDTAAQYNSNITAWKCELTDRGEIDSLVLMLENNFPGLNILVNNAAVQYNYYFMEENDLYGRIKSEIDTNFTAPASLTSYLLSLLYGKDNAAIVNLTSALAIAPKENASLYCATKAAVHSLTVSLRYQLEDVGIKVFELMPPLVETKMTEGRGTGKITPEELVEGFLKAFAADQYEISIGRAKLAKIVYRILPGLISKKLRKSF